MPSCNWVFLANTVVSDEIYLFTGEFPVYILYFDFGKGGEGLREPETRVEGQKVTKLGRKYQHD